MIDDYNHSLTGGLKSQMLPSAVKGKGIIWTAAWSSLWAGITDHWTSITNSDMAEFKTCYRITISVFFNLNLLEYVVGVLTISPPPPKKKEL